MRPHVRKTLEYLLCIAAIGVMPTAVIAPGMVDGKVALSTDSVFAFTPWETARPEGLTPPAHPEQNLMAQRYYPWYVFLSQAGDPLEALWDPLENGGMPFLALWQTRCLSPFSLPFYIGTPEAALTWSVYLKLLAAGLCAFYAARRLGFHTLMSLFVGLAFQLSAGLILWWGYPIADVLPWLPLLVLYCERLALGHFRMWASGTVVLALMLLGGDPQAVVILFGFAVLFLITRFKLGGQGVKSAVVPILMLTLSGVLSVGLTGVQILPFIEFLREARHTGLQPQAADLNIWDLGLVALPHLHGTFARALRETGGPLQTAGLLHVGIAQVALVPVWLAMRPFVNARQRERIEALLMPALLLTILAFLWGPVLRLIPYVNLFGPQHYLAVNAFVLALSAAATAEEWIHLSANDCQDTLKRLLVTGPAFLLAMAGVVLLGIMRPNGGSSILVSAILPLCLFIIVLILLSVTILKPSSRLMGYPLCAVVVVNALTTFGMTIPFTAKDAVYPETGFVTLLRQSGTRVSGSDALSRWPLQANLVSQIYGSSGVVLKRQADYHAELNRDPLLLRRMGSSMLLLTQDDIQGKFAPIRPMLKVEQVFPSGAVLFSDAESQSRAYIAHAGRAMESYDPSLLSSEAPPLMERIIPPVDPNGENGPAHVAPSHSSTELTINVQTDKRGVLVLADSWYPGWTATVDGVPTPIVPVDVMFRGVEVPPGAKEVVFAYQPDSLRLGLYSTAGSGVLTGVGLLVLVPGAIKRLRQRTKWRY